MPTQTKVIHSTNAPLFDVFGPLLQFLVTPAQSFEAFALIRAIVPPGVAIPLHSHADPEVLFVLEGELNVLQYEGDAIHWLTTKPGEAVCIPGDVRHALRNTSPATVILLLTTTPNLYRFFRELGKPFHPGQPLGPPTRQDMRRLLDLAAQHNYWMASPQENAAIGLSGF
jgi:quercetin dioxygenase-like cupin family protein